MRSNFKKHFTYSALALAVVGTTFQASAQDTSGSTSASVLEELIVTARKREQSLQDIPLAISAFDSQELKSAAYDNIVDLSKAAPGLFIEPINSIPARVDAAPRFRGVTFESTSPLQRTASIFIDGILVSGGIQSIGVQDLERVEIIKGPQSALFGRNTFSGAINYITKSPADEFKGSVSVDIASRDEIRTNGIIEGPLSSTVGANLSFSYSDKEGHYDNAFVEGQTLGDEESWSIGGVLEFKPNDKFSVKLRGNVYEDHDGHAAVIRSAGFALHNFGGFPLPGGGTTETVFQGTVPLPSDEDIGLNTDQATFDEIIGIANADPRGVSSTGLTFDDLGSPGLFREGSRFAITAGYEFNDNLRLDVLAGVNEDEYLAYLDFDATAGFGFNTTNGQLVEDESIEFRLSGNSVNERLNWSIGANYVDVEVATVGGFFDGILGFWFPGIFEDPNVTRAETVGVFGSIDYKLTDQFTVILEARRQEDEIFDFQVNEGLAVPISPATFDSTLPRVLLQYEPNDNTLLYASYSEGNLPGGFNPEVGELDATQLAEFNNIAAGITTTFGEETLTNLEFGIKSTLLDGRLAFNLAIFFMEREDQIFSGFELVSDPTNINGVRTVAFTANGATSDINGFELDGTWNVSDTFSLQGSLGYVDATIDSFPDGANSGDFTAVFGPNADVSGQQSPRFPEWTASLSAAYERPVNFYGRDSEWYVRGDVFYTGEFFDENTNLAEIDSATDVNIRTGLRMENLTLELYVSNLFEEDTPLAGNNIADTSLDVRFGSGLFDFSRESVHVGLRDKRQVGIRATYSF